MDNRIFHQGEHNALQSLLVIGTLVIVLKWHSATLNINVTLSTFHKPPRSNLQYAYVQVRVNSLQNIFRPLKMMSIIAGNNCWFWIL